MSILFYIIQLSTAKYHREELRLATQLGMTQDRIHSKVNMAYAAQGKGRSKSQIQCYNCNEYGHIARNCSKKICRYCKNDDHVIKECPIRPPKQIELRAFTLEDLEKIKQIFMSTTPDAFGHQGSGVQECDREGA